ncbi:hypothetical protein NVR12_03525, partial [Staphylococcus pseudintermedius]|nr:hypothetical protein [Staphylococcus pseudintermedius]
MNAIVILGLILFILMLIFGGKTGLVSFLTLFLNFIILFITVPVSYTQLRAHHTSQELLCRHQL